MSECNSELTSQDVRELRREMNSGFKDIRSDIKELSKTTIENKVKISSSAKIKMLVIGSIVGGGSSVIASYIKTKLGV